MTLREEILNSLKDKMINEASVTIKAGSTFRNKENMMLKSDGKDKFYREVFGYTKNASKTIFDKIVDSIIKTRPEIIKNGLFTKSIYIDTVSGKWNIIEPTKPIPDTQPQQETQPQEQPPVT